MMLYSLQHTDIYFPQCYMNVASSGISFKCKLTIIYCVLTVGTSFLNIDSR